MEEIWFDRFFEASYHPSLVPEIDGKKPTKKDLKKMARDRIDNLINGIDAEEDGPKLVRGLCSLYNNGVVYESNANFSVNFPLEGKVNCVSLTTFIVSALERMGRQDIISDIQIKMSPLHMWFAYDNGKDYFEVFNASQKDDKIRDIETLLAANLNNRGCALITKKLYDEAEETFDLLSNIKPDYINLWACKGILKACKSKYDEAIECYDESIKQGAETGIVWSFKASSLLEIGKYTEALECCDKALAFGKEFGYEKTAFVKKGCCMEKMGKYYEALELYDHALKTEMKYDKICDIRNNELVKFKKNEMFFNSYKLNPFHQPTNFGLLETSLFRGRGLNGNPFVFSFI